ncbi:MAG: protein kinase [Actinobacteria bacterium]|uniref:Unannotated protein n=1 Tax=freshwater metagenome TaxID=449393 RepID=A0A6J5ZG43_9ZZZZ|nr:protein kinase [Actinomycetota bacterium]
MKPVKTPTVGDQLGGCRLERLAAHGGMGVVFEATQLALGRRVAVKVISPALADDGEFRERFVREAQMTASVHHPNIVDVYDAGEQDGVLYLVMRFVDGVDLRTVLRDGGRCSPRRAASICTDVAAALDAAHAAGLTHRDVTPSNILLSGSGDGEQALLTDFGLVKQTGSEGQTKSGTWLGTLAFVAPEALRDDPIDGRADVYALGCVLFRMIAGVPPFVRDHDAATIAAHLGDDPPLLSETGNSPRELDAVVAKALAKDPADRYRSAGEFAAAASRALGGAPHEEERTRVQATKRPPAGGSEQPTVAVPASSGRALQKSKRIGVMAFAGLAAVAGAAGAIAVDRAVTASGSSSKRARAVSAKPAAVSLVPYAAGGYSARVPSGWRIIEDEIDKGLYRDSVWRAPAPSKAQLKIAYREGVKVGADRVAGTLRTQAASDPTYSELAWGPIELNGATATRWVYGRKGRARMSWTMNPCGTSVAVHGSAKPSEILRWAPTFRAVAAAVSPGCS